MFSQGYLIDSQICVIVFYLLYVAFLRGRVGHVAGRIYLLGILPVGLLLPLVEIAVLEADFWAFWSSWSSELWQASWDSLVSWVSSIFLSDSDVDGSALTLLEMSPLEHVEVGVLKESAGGAMGVVECLWWVYVFGAVVMGLWLLVGIIRLVLLVVGSHFERVLGLKVAYIEEGSTAFSVFGYVFVSSSFKGSESLRALLEHERCHVRGGHSWDLILINLFRVALWFNPAVWHIASLLRQVHEFQADKQVIGKGYKVQNYVNLLILSQTGKNPELSSQFSYSLTKKRLIMLKKQERAMSRRRFYLTLPVFAALLAAFSLTGRASEGSGDFRRDFRGNRPVELDAAYASARPAEVAYWGGFSLDGSFAGGSVADSAAMALSRPDLCVLDGVEISFEDFSAIDVQQVGSMSVLKGDSAVDLYGERVRKNGVVVVVSKQARQAALDGGASVQTSPQTSPKTSEKTSTKASAAADSKRPEYIVDGKKVSPKEFNAMDPNKIEKVTVLKNTADPEVAQYGKKAKKNGVLIITTKGDNASTSASANASTNSSPNTKVNAQSPTFAPDPAQCSATSDLPSHDLYVLDGVEISFEAFNLIDVGKIALLSVLKGDDAVALYGEKARKNGVVVVVTKDAKKSTEK